MGKNIEDMKIMHQKQVLEKEVGLFYLNYFG